MKKLKVAIVDDHKLISQGLSYTLESSDLVSSIEIFKNGVEIISRLQNSSPNFDIILMDINMPEMGGIEATKVISEEFSDQKVIIITMYGEKEYILDSFRAGARAFLNKNSGSEQLEIVIKQVMEFGCHLSLSQFNILTDSVKFESLSSYDMNTLLTARESQILTLVASELTTSEIAKQLKLSKRTIDSHKQNILNKIGAKNTAGLIKYAFAKGLI